MVWTSEETNGTYCLAWADYDDDGDPDLTVGNKWGPGHNQLYRNDSGTLVLAWTAPDEETTESDGLSWADWDGDGDLDLAVGNDFGTPNQVYASDGGSLTLTWTSHEADKTIGVAWGDWDNDGDPDLAVANAEHPNRLYENVGGDLVLAWTSEESDRSEGLAWADWDGDGDPDLAFANFSHEPNRVYESTGGGLVLAWSSQETDNSLSVAWGDWDNDGDLDLAVGNEGEPNRVYENTGGDLVLAWSSVEKDNTRAVAWGDWDNDGDLDLAVGNEGQPNRVYENTGGHLVLAWSSEEWENSISVAWADYDGDGYLDLAIGNKGPNRLYRNVAGKEPTVRPKPDYSKLTLHQSDHHPDDSFSLTMQAAARLFGKDVDYETVYALSTNAFAPDVRPDEECRSTWRFRGRGQCLDLVAARLGLAVRPIGGFTSRRYGDRSIPGAERLRRAAAAVRPALERGEVVITDSGWSREFWLWGIVREVQDDGTMIGATPNGLKDNTFDHACSFWALIPTEPTLSEHEADVLMLRRAVSRIRADDDPFLPESLACGLPAIGGPAVPGAVVWGLPAMDLWIAQMEKPVYQEDDPGSSEGNAHLTAYHTLHGAEVAAAYLRKQAPTFAAGARPHLEAAAGHYDRIANLLRPAVTGEEGQSYSEFMGDLAQQKAHAENVLKPLKAELAAAADEMEKALALLE